MRRLLYYTPRAHLIQYLNDPSKVSIVRWVEKEKSYQICDYDKFLEEWVRCAIKRSRFIREDVGMLPNAAKVYYLLFEDCLSATIDNRGFFSEDKNETVDTLTTKSTEKVLYVTDKAGPLYQCIIKYLLEYMNTDWIQWVDQGKLQFKLMDAEGFGKRFCKVNHIQTTTPSHMIKLLLSSYCSTGILTKIDKLQYQFNSEWYHKEVKKEENGPWWPYEDRSGQLTPHVYIFYEAQERNTISTVDFPQITRSIPNQMDMFHYYFGTEAFDGNVQL